MEADDTIANEEYTSPKGDPDQPWPTFEFRDTLAEVVLVDHSGLAMRVRRIDVVNDLLGGDPLVYLVPAESRLDRLQGHGDAGVRRHAHSGPEPRRHREARRRRADPDEVDQQPDRPHACRQPVRSINAADTAQIVTNLADLYAPNTLNGSIGSATARLPVDLVQFVARPRVGGPSVAGTRTPRLVAHAGVDVYLRLRALDRVPGATGELTVAIDTISAGRDVNLELRTSRRQPGSSVFGDVIVQVPNETSMWSGGVVHRFHFRGIDADGQRDPARTGVSALLDPAIYVAPTRTTPTSTASTASSVATRCWPGSTSRSSAPGSCATGPTPCGGEFVLFAAAAAAAESPGLTAGRHIVVQDTEGLADLDRSGRRQRRRRRPSASSATPTSPTPAAAGSTSTSTAASTLEGGHRRHARRPGPLAHRTTSR